jgi:hypothetical protein
MIDITNSIPSGVSGDLGYSTLIVRVLDLSSTTPNDYTYYVLVSMLIYTCIYGQSPVPQEPGDETNEISSLATCTEFLSIRNITFHMYMLFIMIVVVLLVV